MTLLLRLLVVAAGVLALLGAGAWVVADWNAASLLRNELSGFGLRRIVTLHAARLPSPTRLVADGVVLHDPLGGAAVARIDHLEVQLGLWDDGLRPRVLSIHGEGGEATFASHGDEPGFLRAVEALLAGLSGEGLARRAPEPAAPSAPPPPLPELRFGGLTISLLEPDGTPTVFRGCTTRIAQDGPDVRVDVDVASGGTVGLSFGAGGLRSVRVAGLAVTPACALFLPADAEAEVGDLQPSGTLDLDLQLQPDDPGAARATGLLRDAALRPSGMPFALEQGTLPFALERGRLTVSDARLSFPGGVARGGIAADADGFRLDVKVADAEFRRADLALLPHLDELAWLAFEDGGNLDLDLHITRHAGRPGLEVDGWGGLFLERLRVGPTKVLVEDVVGSLDVHDQQLTFHELSGRCAGGVASLSGGYDLRTADVKADGAVYDVDIARLDRALAMPGVDLRQMAGFLQGSGHWEGRIGEPRTARGEGQLSVRGGYLWSVPVLGAVLGALSISRPEAERSDSLSVQWHQHAKTFFVDELHFDSDVLALRGEGKVTRDGELDLEITPLPVSGTVGAVLRYVQQQLVKLELRGSWNDPHVRVMPLKIVTGPLEDLWNWITGLFGSDAPAAVSSPAAPTPARP